MNNLAFRENGTSYIKLIKKKEKQERKKPEKEKNKYVGHWGQSSDQHKQSWPFSIAFFCLENTEMPH